MIRRILDGIKRNNLWHRAFFAAALTAYLAYLSYLTFFSHLYGRTVTHRSVNIIPFGTIISYLRFSGGMSIILTNIAGNIAAFVPMGFLLPAVSGRFARFSRAILAICAASAAIELVQYAACVGVSDIDDVILNVLGGILGHLIYGILAKIPEFFKTKK
jgi:glycopeptide antibiotics resistance protein